MPVVTVKRKVGGKKKTSTAKSLVSRELALALQDVKKGRVSLRFTTTEEGLRWLHRYAKKTKSRKRAKKMA